MKKILLSIVCVLTVFALSAQIADDFSDYTVGGKLAEQAQAMGRDYWTTWELQPGTNQDGTIANLDGNKVLNIVKDVDQVLLLGSQTSGSWGISFKIYVATGKEGYFNVMSTFLGGIYNHALEVYFNKDGTAPGVGSINAGGTGTGTFNFAHDTWVDVTVIVDLDVDNAEIYINNDLVKEYQYSLGASGTVPRSLEAWSVFGNAASWDFYVDDIVVTNANTAVLFETDFDELSAGAYVAQSYPDWWTTWDNNPGTDEDGKIVNTQSASAPNSAELAYGTDLVFLAGDKTSGAYTIDFDMYIPDGGPAYFNVLHKFAGAGSAWGIEVYFNNTSGSPANGTFVQQDGNITNFTAPSNTWFPVAFFVDLDGDVATLHVNGNLVLEWQYSLSASGGPGTRQLAASDFYPPSAGAIYYIDNFVYAGAGGTSAPNMDVTPNTVDVQLTVGETVTKEFKVTNTGSSIGDYVAWINLEGGKSNEKANYILTYSSEITGSVYYNQSVKPVMEFAAKYPLSFYCDIAGTYITKIAYFLPGVTDDNKLTGRVYGQGDYNNPGEILSEVTITSPIAGYWNEMTLTDPVLLDGQDLWVAFEAIQYEDDGLMQCDAGPVVENGDWRRSNGGSWGQLHIAQPELGNGNFMIKAFVEGDVIPGCWLSLSGDSYGSILAGDEATFDLDLSTDDLEHGNTYEATIFVKTNDANNELFEIPVSLFVKPIGIEEFTTNEVTTKVYPNPADGMITVESTQIINNIFVINSVGQTVYSAKVNDLSTTLNAADFNTGVYFVKINTETETQTVKLVVQ